MSFFLSLIFSSLISQLAKADGLKFPTQYLSFSKQQSSGYDGLLTEAGTTFKVNTDWDFSLGGQSLERKYDLGSKITDSGVLFGFVRILQDGWYVENQITYNPNAKILPIRQLTFAPHKSVAQFDFGLGFDYREYEKIKAGSVHPTVLYSVTDNLLFNLGVVAAHTDSTIVSYHGSTQYKLASMHTFKFGGAGGETLEDAGLSAKFKSVFVSYGVGIQRFKVVVDYNRYWSNIRHEDSYSMRLEFR